MVLENDRVRILEVRLPPGHTVPRHFHPPRAIVPLVPYRLRSVDGEGRETVVERHPGEVVWSDGEVHSAEALTELHAIEVEVKGVRPRFDPGSPYSPPDKA